VPDQHEGEGDQRDVHAQPSDAFAFLHDHQAEGEPGVKEAGEEEGAAGLEAGQQAQAEEDERVDNEEIEDIRVDRR